MTRKASGNTYFHIQVMPNNRCELIALRPRRWAATRQKQQTDCTPSEDSDQPGDLPSLIRVFTVRSMGSLGPQLSSYGQRKLWLDWADAQADLSLRWAHMPFFWLCHKAAQLLYTTSKAHWKEQRTCSLHPYMPSRRFHPYILDQFNCHI